MINAARSYKEQKQSVIHEIQHIIQGIEGFAGGSSMEHWLTKGADKRTAYNNYIDTAGEIEARDSASRHNLNAEQRKTPVPILTGWLRMLSLRKMKRKFLLGIQLIILPTYAIRQEIPNLIIISVKR